MGTSSPLGSRLDLARAMPIKVACKCGAAFAAKDELAGRTLACPKCKQPLKIVAAQAAGAPAAVAAAAAPHANADLFDGLGMKARDTTVPRCPGCNADLPPNAVLCVKCGYNIKLGRRMQTISMSGEGPAVASGGGHGAGVTSMLMARAAAAAEEDEIAEKSKTKEGMPLWLLFVGLFACVLFGIVMSLIPQTTALAGTGMLLLFAAGLLQLYAWVGIIVVGFKHHPLVGMGLFFGDIVAAVVILLIGVLINWLTESAFGDFTRLFIGVVSITYAMMRTEECAAFLFYMWIAKVLAIVGLVLLFIGALIFMAEQKEGGGTGLAPPSIVEPLQEIVV